MKFKDKSFKKKMIADSRITMDAKHQLTLKKINKEENNIHTLNKQLKSLENGLLIEDDINKQTTLKNNINEKKKEIKILDGKYNKEEYYLNNADLLFKYYNMQSNVSDSSTEDSNNTIMKFFNMNKVEDPTISRTGDIDYKTAKKDESDNIDKFDKINIINKYMS